MKLICLLTLCLLLSPLMAEEASVAADYDETLAQQLGADD